MGEIHEDESKNHYGCITNLPSYQWKYFGSRLIHVLQHQRLGFLNQSSVNSKPSLLVRCPCCCCVFFFFITIRGLGSPFIHLLSGISHREIKTIGRKQACRWFVDFLQDLSMEEMAARWRERKKKQRKIQSVRG